MNTRSETRRDPREGQSILSRAGRLPGRLGTKINGILLLFFLVALAIILATLYVGRHLQGGAAAINEAGAERMRTYRIAYLLEQSLHADDGQAARMAEARSVLESLDATLVLLEEGDAQRPLFLPRDDLVRARMAELRRHWDERLRPLVLQALQQPDRALRRHPVARFGEGVREFVPKINELVLLIETSNARHTEWMWMLQNALVGFALAGTFFLSYLFTVLVIQPVAALKRGMDRMAAAEFGVRLPIASRDELGELASGFNHMADRLSNLYDTLEQRVSDKTRDLEAKNRELAVLYEIAAYLAEPVDTAVVCRRVLERLRLLLGADAAAVRLIDPPTQKMEIVASIDLSERFLRCEALLPVGAGLCGQAAACGRSVTKAPGEPADLPHCVDEGLLSMVAVPISSKHEVLGVLNLFLRRERVFQPNEIQFLEAVGQQLGVAVENRRLVLRGKEMAVSEERNLLAQELHDSIAQSLAFLNIQAQMLQSSLRAGQIEPATHELERMREGIQESYDTVRELLAHFRIRSGSTDLDAGIRHAVEKFEGQTGIRTSFTVVGEAPLPQSVSAIQVLHIVQEALSNVRKHAAASHVAIELRRGDELSIAVRDDGRGFDPAALARDDAAHVGIVIMRERAHRIGARLELQSSPGHGSCIMLVIPKPQPASTE